MEGALFARPEQRSLLSIVAAGQDDRNYFFTKHKSVAIPLYWRMNTKNATQAERQL